MALTLARVETPRGELVLRKAGEHFEVISNGVFLMDTRNGESERLLVRAALTRLQSNVALPSEIEPKRPKSHRQCHIASPAWRVLIGGLGVGFSWGEALADERVARVTVVEIEPTIVDWHERHLRHLTGEARGDNRTEIVIADIADLLQSSSAQYDAICLDIDNGPDWTVSEANTELYGDTGVALLARRLNPDGVLTVWSAAGSATYVEVLGRHFGNVEVIEVPVARGAPDVVFVATNPVAQTLGRDSDSS
jgi:spermidine synthase